MRSFTASIILIIVLLTGAIINDLYIKNILNELSCSIEALPECKEEKDFSHYNDTEEKIRQLEKLWQQNTKLIGLTVNQKYISDITLKLTELKAAFVSKEPFDYLSQKESALHSIANMRNAQCTSFASII